ncbi:sulfite reductase subunit alpha [Massilia rhizosphaerae]|uniref:sulfite reductase subunit alpha n=1 Tax=Massilia rhizosphaerae TaxID=2784389 RepID=UPI001E581E88|nr:sulfite reductase subunit alpha [Massilia rhizosphaerae]
MESAAAMTALLTTDPLRLGGALLLSAGWLTLSAGVWRARRTSSRSDTGDADWLVVHASQTGSAEALAQRTAALLATGGLAARALCISRLDRGRLASATRVLFVASTYGEGDPPDTAARFAGLLTTAGIDLAHLHYAVLALGDRHYANYCGFGRTLDAWLAQRGATRLFDRIDVDRGDARALAAWQHHVGRLAGTVDAPDWDAPAYGDWRIVARTLENPGSAGAPLYRVALAPAVGALPAWEAGDLAQVAPPDDPDHPREYSIASLPGEGRLELLVRLQARDDGSPGAASSWLCTRAGGTDAVHLRLRAHARFRLGANAGRPLVAIGNGSGLAGLRGLLKARIDAGRHDNWLLFGERNQIHDFLLRDELQAWRDSGRLAHLDLAFSRDQAARRYVQDVLRDEAARVRDWVERGAAIYVCGSLQGMAGGVHEALAAILGEQALERLANEGRYRRDVY